MTTISSNPITLEELIARGLAEDAQDLIGGIAPYLPSSYPMEIAHALGYGAACPCGERGLLPGEIIEGDTCKDCLEAEGEQYSPS